MSLELWSTVAAFGTLIVIAVTAIAAFVQLRHLRGTNQIAALNELRETLASKEFQDARQFIYREVPRKLPDEAFRRSVYDRTNISGDMEPIIKIANLFENIGTLTKHGIIDQDVALTLWRGVVMNTWNALSPVIAMRRHTALVALWENFEYLTVLSQDFHARTPSTYPKAMRRLSLDRSWLEADIASGTIRELKA